VPKNLLYSSL